MSLENKEIIGGKEIIKERPKFQSIIDNIIGNVSLIIDGHLEFKDTKKLIAVIFISSLLGACASEKVEDKEDNSEEITAFGNEQEINSNLLQSNNDLIPAPSDNNDEGSNSIDEEALMECFRNETRDFTANIGSNTYMVDSYYCTNTNKQEVTLHWNHPGGNAIGFNIYMGQVFGGAISGMTLIANVGQYSMSYDFILEAGVTYLAITSIAKDGDNFKESDYSRGIEAFAQ